MIGAKGRLLARRLCLLLGFAAAILIAGILQRELQGNFHVVSEGVVYRSARLAGDSLHDRVSRYHIKSILNLMGPEPESQWYKEEVAVATALGIARYDARIPTRKDVSDVDLDRILAILRDAPKPILIHCNAGADRTSLVAALYLYRMECKSADEAERQLSVRYGHFPFFGNSTIAMDRTFRRYAGTHSLCAFPLEGSSL